jgi:hypothetical protein
MIALFEEHPVPMATINHLVNRIGKEARGVPIAEFARPFQIHPRNIDGLFQRL